MNDFWPIVVFYLKEEVRDQVFLIPGGSIAFTAAKGVPAGLSLVAYSFQQLFFHPTRQFGPVLCVLLYLKNTTIGYNT